MPAPEPAAPRITPETLGLLANQLVGMPVREGDRKQVAELVRSLVAEMMPLRAMNVGEVEPATVYDAAEVQS